MSRNVKKSLEKKADVEKIVSKLLITNGLKIDEFLFKVGISMDAYRKMKDRWSLSKDAVENILDKFDVNEGFLNGAEDLTSSGKLTFVENISDNPENPLRVDAAEAYRTIVEGRTPYLLIHTSVLEIHEKQLLNKDVQIQSKDAQISGLHEIIKIMASGTPVPSPKVEKT